MKRVIGEDRPFINVRPVKPKPAPQAQAQANDNFYDPIIVKPAPAVTIQRYVPRHGHDTYDPYSDRIVHVPGRNMYNTFGFRWPENRERINFNFIADGQRGRYNLWNPHGFMGYTDAGLHNGLTPHDNVNDRFGNPIGRERQVNRGIAHNLGFGNFRAHVANRGRQVIEDRNRRHLAGIDAMAEWFMRERLNVETLDTVDFLPAFREMDPIERREIERYAFENNIVTEINGAYRLTEFGLLAMEQELELAHYPDDVFYP